MNQYFAYVRVSTTRQGEQGVSLPQQRDAIGRYAQTNQLQITRWFEEQETAAKQGRPVFGEMVKLLRRRAAAGVIIHKIDRSARNLRDWADLGELIDGGIEVHFANEALDLSSRGGRLSADIQAVVASDYIRNLREETKKGFYGRLKQGFYPMPAPLGYVNNGAAAAKTWHPQHGPLVQQAFELYSTARFNLRTLGAELHKRGLRRSDGSPYPSNRLSELLNNPFYYGLIHIKKTGQNFEGIHQPLISRRTFDRVQAILSGKANTRAQKHDFTYRRRLTCKLCDYTLVGETHKGFIYYRCQTRTCPTTCVREEAVENAVLEEFSRLRMTSIERKYLQEELESIRENSAGQRETAVASLKLRASQTDDRLARLTDAYIDRLIERETFEERKKTLLVERQELSKQIAVIGSGKINIAVELAKFLERADAAYLAYKRGLLDEKRDLLDSSTSNRWIERKSVAITLSLPFRAVANRPKLRDGGPRRVILRNARQLLKTLTAIIHSENEKLEAATTFPAAA